MKVDQAMQFTSTYDSPLQNQKFITWGEDKAQSE